ncbi:MULTISPECIES: diaminopimelate epimerase [unclassified Fusibacter]|uniref:diaminopimelate epimerase n=1 Tax=unclassified Fusibacter TaxID=2624464 RepID=UPI00101055AA|nr:MULTISPECIES: diaminopimelate epimerase [unclassified Fusibacter]MCK8058045.1 diaminopimelate epimerase [Fusibacter sp. A2]NPE20627.1 diaminopimelate epimerase [Fusibacter sp. A1]RXV62834.1 diaminopimelate epimerase [Fusibacter sp. A1]
MKFAKLQAAGNDFIIMEASETVGVELDTLAKEVCHRQFGIGADGLMVLVDHEEFCEMLFYNSDGSLAKMCGNGLRCFVKYIVETRKIKEKTFDVKTPAGFYRVTVIDHSYKTSRISIDMGEVEPYAYLSEKQVSLKIGSKVYPGTVVNMGVPHLVVYYWPDDEETISLGPKLEKDDRFSEGVNVNFVKVISDSEVVIKTWERGAGLTLACGTGACASASVLKEADLIGSDVKLRAPGGDLHVKLDKKNVTLTGDAVLIAIGDYIKEV